MEYILASSLLLINGFIYLSIKSYLETKFKNIATIEDTKRLTEIVETVKKTFHDDTEKLKTQLFISGNKHNILFAEEKESLIKFMSAWDSWMWIMKSDFFDYNDSNYTEISALYKLYDEKFDEVQICISRLELFVNDIEVVEAAFLLFVYTQQLQDEKKKLSDDGIKLFENKNRVKGYLKDYRNGVWFEPSISEEGLQEDIDKLSVKFCELTKKYTEEIKPFVKRVIEQRHKFIDLSKTYIRKDIAPLAPV